MIKVKFFARLREQLQCSELELELKQTSNIEQIKQQLVMAQPEWQQALTNSDLLCALNQTLCSPESQVSNGDEVAFFPPVTGG